MKVLKHRVHLKHSISGFELQYFFQIKSITFGKQVAPLKCRPITVLSTIHYHTEALVKNYFSFK